MSNEIETNKRVVARLYEGINAGQFNVLEEVMDRSFVTHDSHQAPTDFEGHRQFILASHGAFPNLRFVVEDVVGEGDRVVARGRLQGTNTGPFMGMPATGKPADISWIAIYRLANGRIVERWLNGDDLGFMRQLGLAG